MSDISVTDECTVIRRKYVLTLESLPERENVNHFIGLFRRLPGDARLHEIDCDDGVVKLTFIEEVAEDKS